VRELGVIEAPIALTNTLNVGLVLDAVVQYAIRQSPEIGIHTSTVNVVVGETNDGYLNDLQGRHVRAQHVWSAIECAVDGLVLEGAVGAGTGTCCLGWKGGIGTASRVLPGGSGGFTMGALVQSNFGSAGRLMVCGMPIGELLKPPTKQPVSTPENGSIMIILATDSPLSERQLGRLCRRAAIGLAHVGSRLEHSSGDFVIAFTTANPIQHAPTALTAQQVAVVDEPHLLPLLFQAVIESVEEAVLNSLCCADTMVGRDGHIAYGLPLDQLVRLWAELKSTLSPALRCSSSL
jgi:D-aminopeptidase